MNSWAQAELRFGGLPSVRGGNLGLMKRLPPAPPPLCFGQAMPSLRSARAENRGTFSPRPNCQFVHILDGAEMGK